MCLLKDKKVRNNHHKENSFCVAYKILSNCDKSPFNCMFQWECGWNHADFSRGIKDYDNFVFCGLHLMLSLKEAKEFALKHCSATERKIIKVYYQPEDVIAYGHSIMEATSYSLNQGHSVVVKSCLVNSLEDVRSCRK